MKMRAPDGQRVLDIPDSAIHAMTALGWAPEDPPAPTRKTRARTTKKKDE